MAASCSAGLRGEGEDRALRRRARPRGTAGLVRVRDIHTAELRPSQRPSVSPKKPATLAQLLLCV